MTPSMYSKREYREYKKVTFQAMPEGIYISFNLLYIALPYNYLPYIAFYYTI